MCLYLSYHAIGRWWWFVCTLIRQTRERKRIALLLLLLLLIIMNKRTTKTIIFFFCFLSHNMHTMNFLFVCLFVYMFIVYATNLRCSFTLAELKIVHVTCIEFFFWIFSPASHFAIIKFSIRYFSCSKIIIIVCVQVCSTFALVQLSFFLNL